MGSLVARARRRARLLATAASMVILGAVTMVGPAVPRVAAQNAATDCVLPMKTSTSDGIHSMGAINFDNFVRPIGTVKAIMLFVDFPDRQRPFLGTDQIGTHQIVRQRPAVRSPRCSESP